MRIEFLCISVLSVASGPRVKLASCKSALNPHPARGGGGGGEVTLTVLRRWSVLVLLFVALWFILRGDLFYVLPFVILLLCFFFQSF